MAELLFAGVELGFLGVVSFAAVVLGFVLLGIGVLLGLAQVIDGVIRPLPLDQHCCLSSSKLPARSRSRTAGPPCEERMIDEAIASLAQLPKDERSIGALSAFVDNTDPEGIGARLARWQAGGSLGWVFDNEVDAISLGLRPSAST